jgi:hypothetical protein
VVRARHENDNATLVASIRGPGDLFGGSVVIVVAQVTVATQAGLTAGCHTQAFVVDGDRTVVNLNRIAKIEPVNWPTTWSRL